MAMTEREKYILEKGYMMGFSDAQDWSEGDYRTFIDAVSKVEAAKWSRNDGGSWSRVVEKQLTWFD